MHHQRHTGEIDDTDHMHIKKTLSMAWDPDQYARYAYERSRPFVELVNRIGATHPLSVVDLGYGSGELTATLGQRWPDTRVVGWTLTMRCWRRPSHSLLIASRSTRETSPRECRHRHLT